MTEQKNKGIRGCVEVSGNDAIINGIFPEGNSFVQNLRDYDRIMNESMAKIKEGKYNSMFRLCADEKSRKELLKFIKEQDRRRALSYATSQSKIFP